MKQHIHTMEVQMSQPMIKKENRSEYIKLIFFILHHLRDDKSIRRVYQYAQKIWFEENGTSPGG